MRLKRSLTFIAIISYLDIFIEDAFPPIKLTRDQHVIARMIGRGDDIKIVENRGAGKTWLLALCAHGLACLQPGTLVAICSGTAAQATLVLQKLKMLADQNPNIAAELSYGTARSLVTLSKDKGKACYKNGSEIESFSIDSMRGRRGKVIIVDESPEVAQNDLDAVVDPIRNYRRDISFNYDFKDYPSKMISITSACPKSNDFYKDFLRVTRDMARGIHTSFACALDYKAAAANGITEMDFFEKQRAKMPASVFAMEYGSIFVGSENGSAFPYDLTQTCRTLSAIELEQPKNSKSRYIASLDIATSDADDADNSILTVLKFSERSDGSFSKRLVYMRSFHGMGLDVLAAEARKIIHVKFPNIEKFIYDARGLGDSFNKFMDEPWIDPLSGREYPPLVDDDKANYSAAAKPLLHPIRAIQSLNQRMATCLRVALEKRLIELPMNSRAVQTIRAEQEDAQPMQPEELAVFIEADALQFEMGNIVAKVSASNNVIYDTPRNTLHKDRYSSLAMGLDYVTQLEEDNIKKYKRGPVCIGVVSNF